MSLTRISASILLFPVWPPGYIVPPACSSSDRLPVLSSPSPESLPDITQPSVRVSVTLWTLFCAAVGLTVQPLDLSQQFTSWVMESLKRWLLPHDDGSCVEQIKLRLDGSELLKAMMDGVSIHFSFKNHHKTWFYDRLNVPLDLLFFRYTLKHHIYCVPNILGLVSCSFSSVW